jgi:membrane-associated phospholipid phosphatase
MKYSILFIVICLSAGFLHGQENYWHYSSPYKITLKADLISGGTALAVFFAGTSVEHHEGFTPVVPGSFTAEDIRKINVLDRGVAGRWDLKAMHASDILKSGSKLAGQAAVILFPGNLKTRSSLFLMYLEGYYFTNGLTSLAKGLTGRYRPWAYLSEEQIGKLDNRSLGRFQTEMSGKGIADSFFSGHASSTTYSLIFLAKVFNDYFPDTKWRYGIWGICIAGIVTEDWFRVKSGAHFPTDVLVGSLVGGSVGFFVPYFHKRMNRKLLSSKMNVEGLSLTFRF